MPYCIIKCCKNRGKLPGVSYHRVSTRDYDWKDIVNRTPTKNFSNRSVICSDHFLNEDLIKYPNKVMIREGAKPKLYLNESKNVSIDKPQAIKTLKFEYIEVAGPSSLTQSIGEEVALEVALDSTSTDSILSSSHVTDSESRKRKHNVMEGISTSSSADSIGLKHSPKKRRRDLRTYHNYNISPRKMCAQLKGKTKLHSITKRKLRVKTQQVKRLKKQIYNLKDVVYDLKQKGMVSDYGLQHLQEMFSDVPQAIIKRCLSSARSGKIKNVTYPTELKKFAMTLQFYSSKAYEYVRTTFNNCLPHQATIRKWTASINCEPGFSKLCFDSLKLKVEAEKKNGKQVLCALMIDEMSIMKQVDCFNGKVWGYVDLGTGIVEDKYATQALVMMVVSVNDNWKLPVAYFFIQSLNANERANIILECVTRLADVGVKVISLTCDGPTVNFSMLEALGCNVRNINNIKTSFKHPTQEHDIYVILDACHMLKLLRNKWSDLQAFKDPEGNLVEFKYIKSLHLLQESEQLYAANKLRRKHIEWYRQKMKVSLAAQTLSSSVATALEFVKDDLKLEEFKHCGPTINYIKLIDHLFDILNSKNPFANGFKAALKKSNEHLWMKTLNDSITYLMNCTDIKGVPLHNTPRKTPIFGFIITIKSIISIYESYVCAENGPLKYILTFKFSQDHLELFFCAMRARNGWNNNPSALKFYYSYKKLLTHNVIRGSYEANIEQENTEILFSTKNHIQPKNLSTLDITDISTVRKYGMDLNEDLFFEHNYGIPMTISLSEYSENIVIYTSGYVVKMVRRTLKCITCLDALEMDNIPQNYVFLNRKQKGGLTIPSQGVVKICTSIEKKIRKMLTITGNKLPVEAEYMNAFVHYTTNEFLTENIFPSLSNHVYDTVIGEELHIKRLIATIVKSYLKIRLNSISKKCTEVMKGTLIRKKLSKLILFHNQ